MEKKRTFRRWLWYFSLIAALIVVYKLCGNLKQIWQVLGWGIGILAPFIGGFALAFFLYGPSQWLEKRFLRSKRRCWKKLARPLSLTIVYVLLLGLLALVVYLLIPRLVNSVSDLVGTIPHYLDAAQVRLKEFTRPDGLLARLNIADRLDDVYQHLLDSVTATLNTENVVTAVQSVINVTTSLVDVVIAVIVSIYMLSGREKLVKDIRSAFGLFIKPHRMSVLGRYYHRIATIFYSYFYGSFIDALVVGIVVSVGLSVFRVPYAVLLGMVLGLMNMVPYFGSLIGGIGISLITLLSKNIYAALGVALYIIVVQQIDGNIIQPRVVGTSVGLRPIYVLLGITLFGGLFGFWGIFLGVPLMAIIQMLVKDMIDRRRPPVVPTDDDASSPET